MITRKTNAISTTAIWPYTPEPSPPLEACHISMPVPDDYLMMGDQSPRIQTGFAVPRRDATMSPSGRPTLDDVLNNRAPSPYTYAAYTAYLSQQHCLETLEFVTESKKYSHKYYEAAASLAGMPFNTDSAEGFDLAQDWSRLMEIYVKPGAPREINLPSEERDDLLDTPYELKPPRPEALDPAVKRMYDLMSESIFIPFCNSMAHSTHTHHTALSSRENVVDPVSSRERHDSRRRRSPPTTSSAGFQQGSKAGGPKQTGLDRTSSARLSTYVSRSSGLSDTGASDGSGSGLSPSAAASEAIMSPPLTPPQSDMLMNAPRPVPEPGQRPQRADGWKKLGNKLFGKPKR